MIKAITFDFWNTLYRDSKHASQIRKRARRKYFGEFLRAHGCDAGLEDRRLAWRKANLLFLQWWEKHHRALSTRERIHLVLQELGAHGSAKELTELSTAYEDFTLLAPPRLIAGVRKTIPRLAEQYRLAIICDTGITSGRVLRKLLAQDGLLPCFKHCVFSDEVGRTKPHQDNFHLALRKVRCRPSEAVHVGDLIRTDIRGALRAGMRAVLFTHITRYSQEELSRHARGIAVVEHFSHLPAAIAKIS